jgi:hypothetical protein
MKKVHVFLSPGILIFAMFFAACTNGVPVEPVLRDTVQLSAENSGGLVINGAPILAYYRGYSGIDKFPPYTENRVVSLYKAGERSDLYGVEYIKCFDDVGETRDGKLYVNFPEISDEYFAYLDELDGPERNDPRIVNSPPELKYKVFELGGLWPDRSDGDYFFLYADMDGESRLYETASFTPDGMRVPGDVIEYTMVVKKGWNVFLESGVNVTDTIDLSELIWLEESKVRQIPFGGL